MEHPGYVLPRAIRTRRAGSHAAPPLPVSRYRTSPRRARRGTSGTPAVARALALVAGFALALLFSAGAVVQTAYQGRALPGVHVGVLQLAGLTEADAGGVLDVAAHPLLASPAIFVLGSREWRPTAQEMGISLDTAQMARDALAAGRTGFWLLRWPQEAIAAARHQDVALRATVDRAQASAFLSAVALEVDRSAVNAALSVRNGQIVVGQSTSGRNVDIPATLKQIRSPRALDDVQRVDVVVATTDPALPDTAVGEAKALVAKLLAAPLTLHLGQSAWTLSPTALGNMIDFRRVEAAGATHLEAVLNEAKVAAFVKGIAADVDKPGVEAQLRWTAAGTTVIRESSNGVKLDQQAAVRAIVTQAATDSREIALSTSIMRPAVSSENVAQLGIREPIAAGSSKFAGSSLERINNIKVASSRLDGTVIPAGSTFSFLTSLGPITKENGYMEGLTILGDETVPGIGGGVCQVSTTVFRAAFYAGLPIVERHQHAYRVGYYEQDGSPVGFDAAVYDPGVDLRFKNDTGAAILLQSTFDTASSTLTFKLYGTGAGREVKLTPTRANEVKAGPRLPDVPDATLPKGTRKQLEWKADGVDATIRRTVLQGAQTLLADSFFSRYAPWQEKWAIGTGPAA